MEVKLRINRFQNKPSEDRLFSRKQLYCYLGNEEAIYEKRTGKNVIYNVPRVNCVCTKDTEG